MGLSNEPERNQLGFLSGPDPLRNELETLRAVFEFSGDAIFILDEKTGFIDVNRAACERYGYSRDELCRMTIRELDTPDEVRFVPERMSKLQREGAAFFEAEHRAKDGRVIPVEVNARLVRLGERTIIITICRDITARRRAEEASHEIEKRYRTLFENMSEGVGMVDPEERFILANPAAEDIFGVGPGGLTGRTLSDFMEPEEFARVRGETEKRRRGQANLYEHGIVRPDGERRVLHVGVKPMMDAGGRYLCSFGIFRDITDQKRAEAALRAREEKLETILRTARDGFWITDREGRFLEVNDAACRMTGYSREELLGMSVRDIEAEESPAEIVRRIRRIMAVGSAQFEGRHRRKDGMVRDVELSINYLSPPLERFFVFLRDITERKRLETQYRQSQKLESIGRLAGGVAHDFNNLLTVILNCTEMAMRGLDSEDRRRLDLERVLDAGRRARDLTQQLLAFSRRQVMEPRVLDLNSLVFETGKMLRRLIGEDIELRSSLAEDLGTIRADPAQIEQVLLNLAVNSRDAMPSGGEIAIETANATLDEGYARTHRGAIPGDYLLLEVRDTGCGMTEEVILHAFEPFFTTKPVGKGTGLGLASCYGIVKQSGGYIWIESAVGEGTSVKVYLPRLADARTDPATLKESGLLPAGSETILVVEDDAGVRQLETRILRTLGYQVLEAENGASALKIIERPEQTVHLLLTDVIMPGMGGGELARRVRDLRPGIRVLYASGYAGDAIVRGGLPEEGQAILHKPFTLAAIAHKVRSVLDE